MNIPRSIKWLIGSALALLGIYAISSNKKRAIPALLLANSCASGSIPLAFRPEGFSKQEIEQLKAAAEEWQSKSNGKYSVFIDENCTDECSVIRKVDRIEDNPLAVGSCIAIDDSMGIRHQGDCVDEPLGQAQRYEIALQKNYNVEHNALHELGHVFGKHHDPQSGNVMYADVSGQSFDLTDRDIDR